MVQSGIHDEFVDGLRQSIEGLKQGKPFEDGVNVGPLIHEAAVSKVTPIARRKIKYCIAGNFGEH